jgi:hypothetical protein
MKLYTVTYHHSSGSLIDLVRCDHKPSPEEVLSVLDHIAEVEEGAGEYLEIEEYSEGAIKTIGTEPNRPRVCLVVSGGNLQSVHSDVPGLEAVVVDCDNLEAEGHGMDTRLEMIETATDGLNPIHPVVNGGHKTGGHLHE